jgi:NAD(P)-dependent dehydrogenase (short-subunit alcohol dehydrogenase family)
MSDDEKISTALIVGASRGLGLALAKEYLTRGWRVIGTVRSAARTGLHDLGERYGQRLEIERLDIASADEIRGFADVCPGAASISCSSARASPTTPRRSSARSRPRNSSG